MVPTTAPDLPATTGRAPADALSRARLALLLDSTGEAMFGVDMASRCTFINDAGVRMLGYACSDVLTRNMHALIHHRRPDGRFYPEAECPIFAAFRQGLPCRIDDEVRPAGPVGGAGVAGAGLHREHLAAPRCAGACGRRRRAAGRG